MKFVVTRTSDYGGGTLEVEINSLEELIKFVVDNGRTIISDYNDWQLEIYDDYRE